MLKFDFIVTMFSAGKVDEDTDDCPIFVAFEGASREDSCFASRENSSLSFNQLTKRIHGNSDEFDDEEALKDERKDR